MIHTSSLHLKSFENGLPSSSIVEDVDVTAWGRVPTNFSIVEAFDNDPTSREYQDVGFDGLRDADERLFFDSVYIQKLLNAGYDVTDPVYINALNDPSADKDRDSNHPVAKRLNLGSETKTQLTNTFTRIGKG